MESRSSEVLVAGAVIAGVLALALMRPPGQPYREVMTTVFWVGEDASGENGYIDNASSYWDDEWMAHFGGADDPLERCGYRPCDFRPRENPFYVALPYGEYAPDGILKDSARRVPWYVQDAGLPLLKDRWIEVRYGGRTCYGQWEDVGPGLENDFGYVFRRSAPRTTFGLRAGLDVSPALRDCLGIGTNAFTRWRFIDAGAVPDGPWRETITTTRGYAE
jgi:hypothetical protein